MVLKKITSDELTFRKEAIISYNNMSAIVEEGEKIANGTIIKINDDHIIFKINNQTEAIYIQ